MGEFENFVYQYTIGKQEFILRLSHSSPRTEQLLDAEVHWINYLAPTIKQIPQVHPSQNEVLLEKIVLADSYFIASVFDKAKGRHPDNKEDWNDSLYYQWGKLLGNLHALTKNYGLFYSSSYPELRSKVLS